MAVSCTRPAPEVETKKDASPSANANEKREEKGSMILVGKQAPNFKAPAYRSGEFTEVSLADYLGKWVLLCFYPGDFTFV